jgi:hypothetical protein
MKKFEFEFYKDKKFISDISYTVFPVFFIVVNSYYYEYTKINFILLFFNKQIVFVLKHNKKEASTIKYLIFPGNVISKNDGSTHYVKASELIDLYHVNPKECRIVKNCLDYVKYKKDTYIHLVPRSNGDYEEYLSNEICTKILDKIDLGDTELLKSIGIKSEEFSEKI